jgi:hypothetical protein
MMCRVKLIPAKHANALPELLTTKIVHFVKLSKCGTDFTIAFLSSRWSKNIYEMSNLEFG